MKVLVMDNEQKIARDVSSCLQMRYQDVDVILADKGNKTGKKRVA